MRSIEIEPVAVPFYLYRADADKDTRSKSLLQACKLITNVEWKMDPKNAARLIDTDWMRRLTFGLLRLDEVRADVGDIPDLRRIMTTVRNDSHYNRMKARSGWLATRCERRPRTRSRNSRLVSSINRCGSVLH